MFTGPAFTNQRSFAINLFYSLRFQAMRDSLWKKLFGRGNRLKGFSKRAESHSAQRILGTREIPVQQIVGTFNRNDDFDDNFRPLKKHLRDRWVSIYLLAETSGWEAIRVHKIGDDYFVEDGHHRVSVARMLGMQSILAEVSEHPIQRVTAPTATVHAPYPRREQIKATACSCG